MRWRTMEPRIMHYIASQLICLEDKVEQASGSVTGTVRKFHEY